VHSQQYAEQRKASGGAASAPGDDEAFLTTSQVRAMVGNVSRMCLWRWTADPRVAFPLPDAVINNRKYWKRGTVRRWQSLRLIQHRIAI
jgi:hypothetical protein